MRRSQKNLALKISTLVVLTACFVVMSSAMVLAQNLRDALTMWGDEVLMTVYLAPDISNSDKEYIESKLQESTSVAEVKYINQEQALSDFRGQLASYAPDIARDEELLRLIPASLRVRLHDNISAEVQTEVFKELATELGSIEGVDDVSYGQDWIEKYAAFVSAVQITLNFIGVIILFAALFVISNSIRASVQSRKEEIVVLEMVGATPLDIRRPHIFEGAVLGLFSSLLAVSISFGLFSAIQEIILEKLSFLQLAHHIHFLSLSQILAFVLGGAVLGATASYLCIRKINDGFASLQGT